MNLLSNVILCILNAGFMVYMFMLFFSSITTGKLKPLHRIFFAIGIIAVFASVLLFVKIIPLKAGLLILLTILTSLLYRFKWYNSIIFSLLAYALGGLSEFITTALISIVFSVSTQVAIEGPFFILGNILSKLITFLIIILIRLKKHKVFYGTSFKKVLTLCMIPFSSIIVLILQYNYFMMIPSDSEGATFSALMSCAVLSISNIVVFNLIDNLYHDAEKDNQLSTAKELIAAQSEQYLELLHHNMTVLKIRHDQKNFLIGLISDLENGNHALALQTLHREYELLNIPSPVEYKNGIIAAVVKAKAELAEKDDITIKFSYQELEKIKIPAIDLAVIYGNALDNAIEATRKLPTSESKIIETSAKVHNNLIVIAVKNPVTENVDTDNLISTKRKNGSHGFGILSMKNLASRYGGEIMFSCEHKIFETYAVLRNEIDE